MKVTELIETFYFLKNFLICVNATISFLNKELLMHLPITLNSTERFQHLIQSRACAISSAKGNICTNVTFLVQNGFCNVRMVLW